MGPDRGTLCFTVKAIPFALLSSLLYLLLSTAPCSAAEDKNSWVREGEDGRDLVYRTEENGDRVPDFSHAGYRGGGVALPELPARVAVSPLPGDDTALIQAALDQVASLPADAKGHRGAVLLRRGEYQIGGSLVLSASGVVLRGEGRGEEGTILVATGVDRRALIVVRGRSDFQELGTPLVLASERVPVGARSLKLASAAGLSRGQTILVERPGTAEWIQALGLHLSPGRTPYQWRPGTVDLSWDRNIVSVEGDRITLDAPLTTALEPEFGGGTVVAYTWPGRLEEVGVENLRLVSAFDASQPKDENHSWIGIRLEAARNAWVDGVTGLHFPGSLVDVDRSCRSVTLRDCQSLAPVSEDAGYRRHSYMISGELSLVLRCTAEEGRNDFTAGYLVSGPVVFLDCHALRSTGRSGPSGSWGSGFLYDNVTIDGGVLALDNLEISNQGAGWNAANSMLWQCSASLLVCRTPPTAHNWTRGVWGQFVGNGTWEETNSFAKPESLYRAQLRARLGSKALSALEPRTFKHETRVPELSSLVPDLQARLTPPAQAEGLPLRLENGWLTVGGRLLTGRQSEVAWWKGRMDPARAPAEKPSLTRFAPGREGPGGTDNLEALAESMSLTGQGVLRHHYGLWYDRRRDDHQMVRRQDADTWPPFFELPFARSGQGRSWNGLSLYDLTRYNTWYFHRLQRFADAARNKGLALFSDMYFQHNIIESGAHWVDCPWRPVNCLQPTGFPEPPGFQGDVIFMAEAFYDTTHPVRRELHQAYIRHCLDALKERPNVIHSLSAEYSGPLAFARFWTDTVSAWKREAEASPLIALSAPKDVQDSLLADPERAAVFDIIDLQYWWRSPKGLFAPAGGQSLSPRQQERKWKGGKPRASDVASMIWDYRSRHPGKAVMTFLGEVEGWSSLAAGGSVPALPVGTEPEILAGVPAMRPLGPKAASGDPCWLLEEPGRRLFAYLPEGGRASLSLEPRGPRARLRRIDLKTGAFDGAPSEAPAENQILTLEAPRSRPAAFWIDFAEDHRSSDSQP